MSDIKKIKTALVSVYHKDGLDDILYMLNEQGVKFLSTGGTKTFIEGLGYSCQAVEDLTSYPSILGGRVKTLHPKVFGGILGRRDNESDNEQMSKYGIPEIDLVIVDLYPFEDTVASGATPAEIIEKIDIGGISLIRAGAKNFKDVVIVASKAQYKPLAEMIGRNGAQSTLAERRFFASEAFAVSSGYDSAIYNYFAQEEAPSYLRVAIDGAKPMRYGENPHQKGSFFGKFEEMFEQLHGKEISYNNLLDIDAAVSLITEFGEETPAFAILKHNNACGLAVRPTVLQAWTDALAGDPVSAFGGVLITNTEIDADTAAEIDKIFFEVIIAPAYTDGALEILRHKKNRIILVQHGKLTNQATDKAVTPEQAADLLFANKIVKHSKSNAIVLAKNGQLLASGIGQTSRVDALKQSIAKAKSFNFDLKGAVMASDAFFPFADCVEIAHQAGIDAVIQPGGSIRDQETVDFCNKNGIAMVTTGIRHFKH